MGETRTIRTVLELNAQRFTAGAAQASASAKSLAGELAKIGDAQGKTRANYDRVANSLLGVGAAAATGLGLAAKASMDWESAWAGVLKTVDGTDAQLAAVEEGLRGLTKELPASHTEIAAVAEAAGQLGVQTESVVEFTRTMINLGETTNLSAEEAATGLARFSNIMGTSQNDVDRLGAAIVGLGNNYATTEGEILALGMRLAGTSNQLGLTEGDVLGLAAAMSSVGIEAEAGGTAASLGMRKIDKAVREGGESLEGFAEVAGMSSDEFAKLWSDDAAAGLDAFVQGLGRVSDEGGNVAGVLSDLGIKGIRESDTFLRLAGSADILSEALAMGNTEYERNIALVEEAAKRYETTESQIQIARNAIVDAGIDIGAQVLPVLADAAGGIADLASWFGSLPEPVQKSVAGLGALVGTTGLLAGGFMRLVPFAMDTVSAFRDLRTTSPRVASGLGRVGRAAGIAGAAFVGLQIAGGIADSFREAATTSEEMAAGLLNVSTQGGVSKKALDDLFAATGTGNAEVRDLAHAIEILDANALEKAGDFLASGLGVWDTQTEVAKQQIGELDRALASLYQSGNAELVADTLLESGVAVEELIEKFPTLRTELTSTATAMGLEADATTLAKIATGELVPVVDDATGAVTGYNTAQADAESSTDDATSAVQEQIDALQDLEDRLQETANLLLGMRGSQRGFEAAIDDATKAIEENGRTLDITTEKGRANEAALDGIAEATFRWIDSMPDNATADELDRILSRGRDAFLEQAEAVGMSREEAEKLADQLGLLPQFVETEVRVELNNDVQDVIDTATEAVQSLGDPVEVEVDTSAATAEVYAFDEVVEGATGDKTVTIDASTYYAEGQLRAFQTAVNEAGGTVTINGETMTAEEALSALEVEINEGEGTVTINGFTFPADQALMALTESINMSEGTVDVYADTTEAEASANHAARDRDSTVDVGANTSGAEGSINHAARDRSSTIRVKVAYDGSVNGQQYGMGYRPGSAHGGWLNEGLNAGGWVPGPYPGPGIDNVLWPVKPGLAGGGMQMQPLAGTEFVVNGQSARQWGPALEAMNSGVSPAQMAAMLGGGNSTPSLALTQNIQGPDARVVAHESAALFDHKARTMTAGYHR